MAGHITSLSNCVGFNMGVGLDVSSNAGVSSEVGYGIGVGLGMRLSMAIGAGIGSSVSFSAGMDSGLGMGLSVAIGTDISLGRGFGINVTFGANNSMSSSDGNGIGFGSGNGMGFGGGNGVSSSGGNSGGSSTAVDMGSDPREGLVCLYIQLVRMVIGLASFRVYIMALTFLVTDCGYPTPASSVSWAVKPLHLLSHTKAVFVLVTVWSFENTLDAKVYNEFLEMASDDKE